MNTFFSDASPVSISGAVGTGVSLLDLLKKAYGDNASTIQSVSIAYLDASQLAASNLSYWDPAHPVITKVLNNGVDIGGAPGNFVTIDAAHFQDVQISIGNNIVPNVFLTVPESFSNGDFVGHSLAVTTLLQQLDAHVPANHVPTAADIVSTARMIATVENGVANVNDCHGIATDIAGSAGATLDPNSGNTADPRVNEESGFWRIAYRGTDAGAVDDWQTKVQAGDIVRMARVDGGVHTVTVTAGLNADGNHPGQIEVVDNWNAVISEHWADYDNDTVKGSVTIYRLTTDGLYLTDQSSDGHGDTILGSQFNDLIKAGGGNDTLLAGVGNDTMDGGGGTDTAVFSGTQSDYKITVNGGMATLTDLRAGTPDGTDTISNIEQVKFGSTIVNFSDLKSTVTPPPVAGSIAINDATITEGNSGTRIETFTVTRTGGSAAFDVNFVTTDRSATTADGDYVAKSGVLHFAAGVNTQTISVVVNGDTKVEANDTFSVNLSGATNGATMSDAQGIGTIFNDDVAVTHHVANDFNGDGASDVLFNNTATGGIAVWELNGNHIDLNATVGTVAGWHVDGTGDFNNDGKADMLLQNGSGTLVLWQMNGASVASSTVIGTVGSAWHFADAADFNGDGKADILWQNDDGRLVEWQMNGASVTSSTVVGAPASGWHFADAADFNGDGKADILLQNNDGRVVEWQMNGASVTSSTVVGTPASGWHIADTGDFNGDHKADILLQNNDGRVVDWQMNGASVASSTVVGSAPGWSVVGTGDYNHDGKADVLLQNASGSVAQWQMTGAHIDANVGVGSHSVDWHIV
jgi:hypothetical protein